MKIIYIILFSVLFISCKESTHFQIESREDYTELEEATVFEIKLGGKISEPYSELSGLAWYGDNLILLPQFPYLFGDGLSGSLFYLSKEKILRTINSKSEIPLTPDKIEIDAYGLEKFNWLGSGYEGIIFNDDDVYFVLESYGEITDGYVVKGKIIFTEKKIKIDAGSLVKVEIQNKIPNLSEETITMFNEEIFVIKEVNGQNIHPNPFASKFSGDLTLQEQFKFPTIEYRITDATEVEPDNTFWVINYLWPGEIDKIKPAKDSISIRHGVGKTQKYTSSIERLLKLKFTPEGIKLTGTKPIYLELEKNMGSRNWEGIVKLDEIGFLIVTDKFPRTILGFVKYP